MDKYLEKEKRLAELLGTPVTASSRTWICGESVDRFISNGKHLPRWCRDNGDALRLSIELELNITYYELSVMIDTSIPNGPLAVAEFKDHPDKAAAVRFVIVQAAIAKLESKKYG